jgi:hypothetical protein
VAQDDHTLPHNTLQDEIYQTTTLFLKKKMSRIHLQAYKKSSSSAVLLVSESSAVSSPAASSKLLCQEHLFISTDQDCATLVWASESLSTESYASLFSAASSAVASLAADSSSSKTV